MPKFFTRDGSEHYAKITSYVIQYCIFVTLTLLLSSKGLVEIIQTLAPDSGALRYQIATQLLNINTLLYVSLALAISCGIQLAYMLVTHGPDEAIEPVMLGIASAVLLILSKIDPDQWTISHALVILIMIICIAILFALSIWMSKSSPSPSDKNK
ncbi:hypothetical protein NGC17_06465 [Citrobacter portucalensis]|uniref:hypothetical protein n=1 Tax=Citrobacter portucalensis TaxID=1639133 RepID=UPI002DB7830B|nr:hypothetical protein [Citrobacter portucalensis]MEB7576103.1 hypothetical protein [Citrobacter portucalensis]